MKLLYREGYEKGEQELLETLVRKKLQKTDTIRDKCKTIK